MKTQINETKRMQQLAGVINEIETNYPSLLEVIKDGYYCFENADEFEFYTKEEINVFSHPFVVGDVWKFMTEETNNSNYDPEIPSYECIKGKQKGETWEVEDILDNNKAKKFFKVVQQ